MQNAVQNAVFEAQQEESRPDSLFGICQAAGDQLGINPVFLRIGLIGLLFFGPLYMLGAYAALGVVVGASYLLFPPRKVAVEGASRSSLPPQAEVEEVEEDRELIAA